MDRNDVKGWLKRWKEVAEVTKQLRKRELPMVKTAEALLEFQTLFRMAQKNGKERKTSGMVEMQALLSKLRRT